MGTKTKIFAFSAILTISLIYLFSGLFRLGGYLSYTYLGVDLFLDKYGPALPKLAFLLLWILMGVVLLVILKRYKVKNYVLSKIFLVSAFEFFIFVINLVISSAVGGVPGMTGIFSAMIIVCALMIFSSLVKDFGNMKIDQSTLEAPEILARDNSEKKIRNHIVNLVIIISTMFIAWAILNYFVSSAYIQYSLFRFKSPYYINPSSSLRHPTIWEK